VLSAAFLPALALVVGALATPPPLRMSVVAVQRAPRTADRIEGIQVMVRDVSPHAVAPHFAWRATGSASDWWRIVSGPRVLAPGARGVYDLVPVTRPIDLVRGSVLLAVSDHPMTLTNVRLPDRFTG